jgi:crossover junction endodeoxyribonuclease RusA
MITIFVHQTPGPQGSKRHVGRGVMIESSAKVKPWREAVKWAWRELNVEKICGPVAVTMVFTLIKPKSAPKRRVTYPDRTPDVDKLVRSTCDALVQAGAIEDDARVVHLTASKVYPSEGYQALKTPGAVIRISKWEGANDARTDH